MEYDVIGDISNDIHKILDETDKISDLLYLWKEITEGKKKFEELNERIRVKIKTYLKERKWSNYKDEESGISATISSYKMEKIDKNQLKMILNESEMAQVTRITTVEKMQIITPETRERLKKIVKKPKKIGEIS